MPVKLKPNRQKLPVRRVMLYMVLLLVLVLLLIRFRIIFL
jgi:hypothetical protein